MSKLEDMNEKRIDKLETEINEMNKTIRVDIKELREDMKETIKSGFSQCREIMPLKCEANFKKSKGFSTASIIGAGTAICSVLTGVVVFLVKSGILDGMLK